MRPTRCRSLLPIRLVAPLGLVVAAQAQTPIVDIDFVEQTPLPDVDLLVVRERAYDTPVDLTPFGIGAGPVDHVQSIYLRMYKGGGSMTTVRGHVTFPAGVEVIGVVTSAADLGGSSNNGTLTATDLVFGIDPALADKYSSPERGIESSSNDRIAQVDASTVVFSWDITTGLDDFRIIVDYGSDYPASATFDVVLADPVAVPTVPTTNVGIRIGDDGGVAVGAGDLGEVSAARNIPLIGGGAPVGGSGYTIDAANSLYVLRDSGPSHIDAYDPASGIHVPTLAENGSAGTPRGIVSGPLGLLWVHGTETGTSMFAPRTVAASGGDLDMNLSGSVVGIAELGGDEFFYELRNDSAVAGSRFIDEIATCDLSIVRSIAVDQSLLGTGADMVRGSDGMLYVLGTGGALMRIEPAIGTNTFLHDYSGSSYRELACDMSNGRILLAQDSGATTTLHLFDIGTGVVSEGVASIPERNPRGVAVDAAGTVWVAGNGGSGDPAQLFGLDPSTWTVVHQTSLIDMPGSIQGLEFLDRAAPAELYCGPAVTNSTGHSATIRVEGSRVAGAPLDASVYGLPRNSSGYFLASQGNQIIFPVLNSNGRICLGGGGQIARFAAFVLNSGDDRRVCLEIDTSSIPTSPMVSVQSGETWNFQYWFRDSTSPSSFSEAIAVTFL